MQILKLRFLSLWMRQKCRAITFFEPPLDKKFSIFTLNSDYKTVQSNRMQKALAYHEYIPYTICSFQKIRRTNKEFTRKLGERFIYVSMS